MKRRNKIILGACCIVAAAAIALFVWLYSLYGSNAIARGGEVYIPDGTSTEALCDSLRSGEYVKSMTKFQTTAGLLGLDGKVRSGHYTINEGMSYVSLVRMFQRGLQTPVRVTFNNMRTLPQLAGRVAEQIEPDSTAMLGVLTSDTVAAAYGFGRETFIAMFIPDSYELYWTTTPRGFTDRMHKEYERFWTAERDGKLKAVGLSRIEAVTLASIVYEETKMQSEMPDVAGVYINRLRLGMPLQADPTVKFAVGDFMLKRILNRHIDTDSPYNTYKNAGLPPGPICMPSVAAVEAVLNYRKHNYLYFCARADFSGYHDFSRTLTEHNRKAAIYHQALSRAGIR